MILIAFRTTVLLRRRPSNSSPTKEIIQPALRYPRGFKVSFTKLKRPVTKISHLFSLTASWLSDHIKMRLLHSQTLKLEEFNDLTRKPYAILSHTWGEGEVSFQEMQSGEGSKKAGYSEIRGCCKAAAGMGSSTFGSILAASTRRAARNFQKQLIRCISGTKKLKFAMFTCRMSSPRFRPLALRRVDGSQGDGHFKS